jgi:hypothetical protein
MRTAGEVQALLRVTVPVPFLTMPAPAVTVTGPPENE